MDQLVAAFDGARLCLGDFNSVVEQDDKLGGNPVSASSSYGMRNFMIT